MKGYRIALMSLLTATMVTAGPACPCAIAKKAPTPATPPINLGNLQHLRLSTLPPEERNALIALIRGFARAGARVNSPDFWKVMNDPTVTLRFARCEVEPLRHEVLAALQRTFLKACALKRTSPQAPLAINLLPVHHIAMGEAALLMRYGRLAGVSYLGKQFLHRPTVRVALIFALQRDPSMLSPILKTFDSRISSSRLGPTRLELELAQAIVKWRGAHRIFAAFRQHPHDEGLACIMARAKYEPALPLVKRLFRKNGDSVLAGAILALDPGNLEAQRLLSQRYTHFKDLKWGISGKFNLVKGCSLANTPENIAILRSVINRIVREKHIGTLNGELVNSALKAMLIFRAPGATDEAMQAIRLLVQSHASIGTTVQLAYFIHRYASKRGKIFIVGAMSKRWLAWTHAIRTLPAIPERFLPQTSQLSKLGRVADGAWPEYMRPRRITGR